MLGLIEKFFPIRLFGIAKVCDGAHHRPSVYTIFFSLFRKYTVYQFSFESDEYTTCTCISSLVALYYLCTEHIYMYKVSILGGTRQ